MALSIILISSFRWFLVVSSASTTICGCGNIGDRATGEVATPSPGSGVAADKVGVGWSSPRADDGAH
ncbi:hypothetical protein E2562_027652 [Oryza meyeriana var. granulata]|uniref:Secreted protein n=1 Tax=Oryza meyeriana var. granulata TaxID=110450 RepID=A0A6G1E382_9ORYZ|nr:hypothetical protein E2562_027652 [Oryza meyeriana var. granulata]